VAVSGVVTAEAGRIGLPPLLAIADSTGGLIVRLPDGASAPARGATVLVRGPLADPYGQLELRSASGGFSVTGTGSLPAATHLDAGELGEATEGRLAEINGTVASAPTKGTSGDFTVTLTNADGGTFRVLGDASSRIDAATFAKGKSFRLTGIVGQRASRKGALDGYRLYLRDAKDVAAVAGPGSGSGGGSGASVVSISTALAYADDTNAVVEGTVTAPPALLDSTGRRIVIQDRSGAIEVLLPIGERAPSVGSRVRITGTTGHAYGAPRIGAREVQSLGNGPALAPVSLGRAPAERDEWQLVRISGTVEKVERLGDRWRAEVALSSGGSAPVSGQAGAGIPSTAIVVGRPVTVAGIVRRPYPTATDRRFSVLPRDSHDLAVGPAGSAGTSAGAPGGGSDPAGPGAGTSASPTSVDITPDTDLAVLGDRIGERVRIGGLIARLTLDGFELDDATALARVELVDGMLDLLPHLRSGEAIAATGIVELDGAVPIVVVGDDGTLFRVGSLGQALPVGAPTSPAASEPAGGGASLNADATGLGPDVAPSSVFTLAALVLLSVAATIVRRRLLRRRLRAVLVARLTSLRDGGASMPGPADVAENSRPIGVASPRAVAEAARKRVDATPPDAVGVG